MEIDGYIVTIANEEIIDVNKVGPRPQVSDIKVVINSDGSGTGLGANSQEEGTTLYIDFTHSIEGGTTTVSPSIPYAVTANGKVSFTVTGTIGDDTYTKTINVVVDQYASSLKIGTYVKYNVTYKDVYSNYDFTADNGWRVLESGTNNGDGTYSGVKLISTGIPVNLYYYYGGVSSAQWAGTAEQITNYTNKFYTSGSSTSYNMYAVAGLFYNFRKIPFNQGIRPNANNGGYVNINGKTFGTLTGEEFLAGGGIEVHNLTMYELNQARNKKAGSILFGLNEENSNSTDIITTSNDAATGLFYLRGLNKFNYTSSTTGFFYWLASPYSRSDKYVWKIGYDGGFNISNNNVYGVRPVVSLPSNVTLDIIEN